MNRLLINDYSSNTINHTMMQEDKQVTLILESYVKSYNTNKYGNSKVIVSKPMFKRTINSIEIVIFYFEGKRNEFAINFVSTNINKFISKYYNKDVSVNFIKIHYPYMNASIFSQYLFHNSPSYNFMHFQNAVIKYLSWHGKELLSHIKGIKIEVSGRITTEKIIPRVTKKSIVFGSLSNSRHIDFSKHVAKNFIGSITIKV